MLWLLIELNIIISIFCLYLAWRISRFRQILQQVEQTLNLINNCTNNVLSQTPEFLQNRQQRVNKLRQQYQQLDRQIKPLQQIVAMFWLLRTIWHRFRRIWQ